jgi:hypothetical protein
MSLDVNLLFLLACTSLLHLVLEVSQSSQHIFFEQSTLGRQFIFKVPICTSFYEMHSVSPFISFLNVQFGTIYY